jgi:hypothetical protein
MNTIHKLTTGLLAIGLLQAVPAFSAELSSLPAAKTQNGITYISGGIGEPEAAAMKAAANQYNLALTFAEQGTGDYLADVKVHIKDLNGKEVLDIASTGPLLLSNLPAGKYLIQAQENGKALSRTVDLNGKQHADFVFYWPQDVVS